MTDKYEKEYKDWVAGYIIKPGMAEPISHRPYWIPQWEHYEPLVKVDEFKVFDLNDQLIGTANTLEEAQSLFKEKYIHWNGDCDMFIEGPKQPVEQPVTAKFDWIKLMTTVFKNIEPFFLGQLFVLPMVILSKYYWGGWLLIGLILGFFLWTKKNN